MKAIPAQIVDIDNHRNAASCGSLSLRGAKGRTKPGQADEAISCFNPTLKDSALAPAQTRRLTHTYAAWIFSIIRQNEHRPGAEVG